MSERIVLAGRTYLRVETVASCYGVETRWLLEAWELGLVRGEPHAGSLAIEAAMLDRVAELVRLHFRLGVDLAVIPLLLSWDA